MKRSCWLVLLVLCACPASPPTPPPTRQGSCEAACVKMIELGCVSSTTPDGQPCSVVCADIEATGLVSWHTSCIVDPDVTTCHDVDACRSRR